MGTRQQDDQGLGQGSPKGINEKFEHLSLSASS